MTSVLTLPGVEHSVRQARRFTRGVLGADHPLSDDAELCVSELVTNAINHSASGRGGKVTIALAVTPGGVRIEVTDDGAEGAQPYIRNDPEAEDGRGLFLVACLASAHGVRAEASGTTVWAQLSG